MKHGAEIELQSGLHLRRERVCLKGLRGTVLEENAILDYVHWERVTQRGAPNTKCVVANVR